MPLRGVNLSAPNSRWGPRAQVAVGAVLVGVCLFVAFGHPFKHYRTLRDRLLARKYLKAIAELEPIDAHVHILSSGGNIAMLQRLHMHVIDIWYVDDTERYFASPQRRLDIQAFVTANPGRAWFCTTFDPFRFNEKDFQQKAIAELDADFARGAVAAKLWKNIGLELKDGSGKYVLPDDPRLEPIYRDIAARNKTLIAHVAEPDLAWASNVRRTAYFLAHPQWDMARKPDAPSKAALLEARDHILAANPDLRVIGAHFGAFESDLETLADRLDRYPNFAVDTSARIRYWVVRPNHKVRAFILKYQDRILYGTDLFWRPGGSDEEKVAKWEKQYVADWRYLATDDEFIYQGLPARGLALPESVLKKIYRDNAIRWIPGIDPSTN
jgi:hypothetical protein